MKRAILPMLLLIGSLTCAGAPAKVLLLPFDSAGPAEKQWIAKAVQQNLIAELTRIDSVTPVAGTQIAATIEDALKAAQNANADYVVFGSYQAVDADLRMTGQVLDVAKKQAIAGLKSTGTQRDLFGMEDVIANQVRRALPQPIAQAGPEMLQQPPAQPVAAPPLAPPVVNVNQQANNLQQQIDRAIDRLRYATDYGDAYDYPSYFYSGTYGPYTAYPIFINNGFHHHHYFNSGSSISGSFHGGNFSGSFNTGGGTIGRNFVSTPTGNYANFGRMTMQSPSMDARH
jgi:TolB-like protein